MEGFKEGGREAEMEAEMERMGRMGCREGREGGCRKGREGGGGEKGGAAQGQG